MEQDSSSMEKRFAYKFLKKLLKYVDSAQEFIAHLGRKTPRPPSASLTRDPREHCDWRIEIIGGGNHRESLETIRYTTHGIGPRYR